MEGLEQLDPKDSPVQAATQEHLVVLEQPELRGLLDFKDLLDLKDLLDSLDHLEELVVLEQQDHREHQDPLGRLA